MAARSSRFELRPDSFRARKARTSRASGETIIEHILFPGATDIAGQHDLREQRYAGTESLFPSKSLIHISLRLPQGSGEDTFPLMSIFNGLGRALRWLRDRQGKRQYQVADAAGITKAMLSAYETGKQKPSLDTLEKILGALNGDLNDLHNA